MAFLARYRTAFCSNCNHDRAVARLPKGDKSRTGRWARWVCLVCREPVSLDNRRGAKPTRSKITGAVFQSKEESRREPVLVAAERGGIIRGLRAAAYVGERQTERYRLEVYGNGAVEALASAATRAAEHLASLQPHPDRLALARKLQRCVQDLGRSRQKITTYRPDYTYTDVATERLVVEDVKGWLGREQHFLEKRRLMAACHDIDVQVIRGNGRSLFGRMR